MGTKHTKHIREKGVDMIRRYFVTLLLLVSTINAHCGGGVESSPSETTPTFANSKNRRTCLVLSVGGINGIAHLGAIKAVKDESLSIDCVVGNSMGSLVGSLYATAPDMDTTKRFKEFFRRYFAETKREAQGNMLVGALLGGFLVLITGGAAAPALAAAAGGAAVGGASTDKVDLRRLVSVMDGFYEKVQIENLPIKYITFYEQIDQKIVSIEKSDKGNLAEAVGKSIANPHVFQNFNAVKEGYLDPGVDRVSAIPINDTCILFPDSRILAINVTGKPAYDYSNIKCPVLEVKIAYDEAPELESLLNFGPEFEKIVDNGYRATLKELYKRGL